MRFYSNSTTERLEAFARARGLTVGIVKAIDNSAGMWFVINEDSKPLRTWISLGWTTDEAREAIERMAEGRPTIPSETGYSSRV